MLAYTRTYICIYTHIMHIHRLELYTSTCTYDVHVLLYHTLFACAVTRCLLVLQWHCSRRYVCIAYTMHMLAYTLIYVYMYVYTCTMFGFHKWRATLALQSVVSLI